MRISVVLDRLGDYWADCSGFSVNNLILLLLSLVVANAADGELFECNAVDLIGRQVYD